MTAEGKIKRLGLHIDKLNAQINHFQDETRELEQNIADCIMIKRLLNIELHNVKKRNLELEDSE